MFKEDSCYMAAVCSVTFSKIFDWIDGQWEACTTTSASYWVFWWASSFDWCAKEIWLVRLHHIVYMIPIIH